MNTEKMRQIAMLMHLTIHKIGFHIKFPATLSLELQLDRKNTCIVDGILLGKDSIAVNKQARFEAFLNYDESSKSYESKKATILICIKTKTSENKLTAGVVPLQLTNPNQHLTNVTARPLRCNDPKAFIEYSLRTETVRKPAFSPDQASSSHAGEMQDTKKTIFKSAVHYNNNNWADEEDPQRVQAGSRNELDKYLSSHIKNDQRKRYKSSGKLPLNSMQNCEEEDESKTEIISYCKGQVPNECSIVSSRHNSIEKQARQLSKRSEVLSKQISEARLIQQNLKAENKDLRVKISKYEHELDEQSSQIISLHKRCEVRENSSVQEVKQLKSKLSEAETQLHQLLLEKNQLLNQMEGREKEVLAVIKQKEKLMAEERRKLLVELQLKKQQKEALINDNNQLQDSLNHSQRMITDFINQMEAKEKECQKLQKSLQDAKLQMLEKMSQFHGLETQVVDRGKAVEDLKAQKKLIYELKHERDQKEIAIAQSAVTIKELQLANAQKAELLRTRASSLEIISKENEALKNQVKQELAKQEELIGRVKECEVELKRSADNSNKISKQIKSVQSELNGIKRQASSEAGEKTRLVGGYEDIIASLQQKLAVVLDEKEEQVQVIVNFNSLYKQKDQECYDLGQQLIACKEEGANLTNDIELLREENSYLNKCLQELTEKEEKLLRTEERLQYNERLYEELQQKHELQRIQFQNELRVLEQRGEEKAEALQRLSEQLRKAEQELLEMQDQIQTLRISLTNRTSELNFLRMENDRNRDNTIQFQQRMALLRRTEDAATSTLEELREENDTLRRVVHENSQAINSLGKRYDSLYRSTVQSLNKLLDSVRSQRSIINSSVRHQKPEISSLLNDCIRYIASERECSAVAMGKLSKTLQEESVANRENMKIIRLKAQIQKELEDEMKVMKAFEESLQANIAKLNKDIEDYLQTIKKKECIIADLNTDIATLHKDHANSLAKKDEVIQKGEREIGRLNHQLELDAQRYNASIDKVKLAMANLEAELQGKISSLNQTVSEIGGELKSERQTAKQQRLRINELESGNAKLSKQKQQVVKDLERRTDELIASRLESEARSKALSEKEAEVITLQRSIEKLSTQKNSLQSHLQKRDDALKELSIKKAEYETTLKERNNEILLLKIRIDEVEDAKIKLIQQKQDLLKGKSNQQALVSTLNQNIKSLKDTVIISEEKNKKLAFQKQCTEKESSKKLNIFANQKATLERQLNELKLKVAQKEGDFTAKERALQNELKASKVKVDQHSSLISDLRREIEAGNAKMSNLLKDFNAKTAQLQSKEKNLLPSAGKLKEVMQSIGELRAIGKEYEASKKKLLRLTNNAKLEQNYERTCDLARELGTAINKVKIQVLNRLGLPIEVKTSLLQGLKGLQVIAEKFSGN